MFLQIVFGPLNLFELITMAYKFIVCVYYMLFFTFCNSLTHLPTRWLICLKRVDSVTVLALLKFLRFAKLEEY